MINWITNGLQPPGLPVFTCIIESKQQWTWYSKRQNPNDRNHDCDPPPGAVACVV